MTYDPKKVTYEKLVDAFWRSIDPTTVNEQFGEKGSHYRTVIYYGTPEEQKIAEASKAAIVKTGRFKKPIVTEISPATTFYRAEEEHQDYYKKKPKEFKEYCAKEGRDAYLTTIWGI